MNRVVKQQKGFTLIELMLAMAFIALLLLAVAMTIIQIANIYNRGLILKELNQVSREITDELDHAMRASGTFSLNPSARRYYNDPTVGGRLCLGQYSYIWNYGKAISIGNTNLNKFTDGKPITFVKAPDSGANYCVLNTSTNKYPTINPVGAVEMIQTGDHKLAIHSMSVTSNATASDTRSGQQLYKISFTLGTNDQNALVADQSACKAPNITGADPNYCSIQQFTIVLRVVNGVN